MAYTRRSAIEVGGPRSRSLTPPTPSKQPEPPARRRLASGWNEAGLAASGETDSGGEVRSANMATRYEEGDVVATPDDRGVVAAVLTEQFYFPQEGGEDEYERVSATSDQPVP